MAVWHLKQIEKMKKFNKWVPHELTISQKNCRFQVFSYSMQWQWIISQSDCDMQLKVYFIQQPVATISVVGLRRRCKALSKAKLKHTHTHTKDHGHCCVIWYQSHLLQLSESWWNHCIWEVCSANWWDALKTATPQPALVNRMGPFCCLLHTSTWSHVAQPTLQKLNELGYKVLPHLPYSPAVAAKSLQSCLTPCDPTDGSPPGSPVPGILQARTLEWVAISFSWPLTNWPPHFQAARQFSAGKVLPQAAGCRKCFPRVCRILKHATGINKHFFLAKMCWL